MVNSIKLLTLFFHHTSDSTTIISPSYIRYLFYYFSVCCVKLIKNMINSIKLFFDHASDTATATSSSNTRYLFYYFVFILLFSI